MHEQPQHRAGDAGEGDAEQRARPVPVQLTKAISIGPADTGGIAPEIGPAGDQSGCARPRSCVDGQMETWVTPTERATRRAAPSSVATSACGGDDQRDGADHEAGDGERDTCGPDRAGAAEDQVASPPVSEDRDEHRDPGQRGIDAHRFQRLWRSVTR